jgi:RNA polymerase sigma-70 factor (ECF subfamily)
MAKGPAIDRGELEALYRTYGALVKRRARGILGDDHEAQDAMQEVFVRVIGAMGEFRRQSQPSTWLYRITTNLCLNRLRDGRRRRDHLSRMGQEAVASPRSQALSPELKATLQRVLTSVPTDLAEVAVYYYVDEMDQAEIAKLVGVARRTVGYRLDRFRAEATKLLESSPAAAEVGSGVPKARGSIP